MGWGAALGIAAKVAPAAISATSSLLGVNKSAKAAKQNTATQINWEREQAQNRIQWAVQDAIKAGVNPGVAVGQAPGVSSISPSMPDTSGYTSAGQAITKGIELTQRQKEVDAEATKDYADALNAEVDAGLKPRETAVKEMNAETERRRQEQDAQESLARIQRIMTLLPGETEQQKQQNMQNAMDIALRQNQMPGEISEAQAENRIREMTGGLIGLNDLKAIIAGVTGGATYHYEQKQNRTSAEKIANDRNKAEMDREKYRSKASMEREYYKESQKRHKHKRVYNENGYDDYDLY